MLLAGLEANSFILFFRQMPLLLPMACYLDCCWYICRCCFSHLLYGAFFLACAKHHHIVEYEMLWVHHGDGGQLICRAETKRIAKRSVTHRGALVLGSSLFLCLCAPYFGERTWANLVSRSMPVHRLNVYFHVYEMELKFIWCTQTHRDIYEMPVEALALLKVHIIITEKNVIQTALTNMCSVHIWVRGIPAEEN